MSSRIKIALVLLFAALLLMYVGFRHAQGEKEKLASNKAPPASSVALINNPSVSAATVAPSEAPSKIQVSKPPLVSDLRKEAAQDPHETPPSLLRFGVDLGVRLKGAKKNKTEALALLDELKTCAQPEQIDRSPIQARALCLVTARDVEQAWPELHDQVEDLVEHSDAQTIQLASKITSKPRE